jgi:hypothetical protein
MRERIPTTSVTSTLDFPLQASSAILRFAVTSRTNSHLGLLILVVYKRLPFFTVTSVTSVTLAPEFAPQALSQMLHYTPSVTNCNIRLLILVIYKRLPFFTATISFSRSPLSQTVHQRFRDDSCFPWMEFVGSVSLPASYDKLCYSTIRASLLE